MLWAQTTRFGLLDVFQEQNLVDQGNPALNLDLSQGMANSFSDMLRMGCFATYNHAQTNDRRESRLLFRGQFGSDRWNFKGARHTYDFD